jgi:hypothetical protein
VPSRNFSNRSRAALALTLAARPVYEIAADLTRRRIRQLGATSGSLTCVAGRNFGSEASLKLKVGVGVPFLQSKARSNSCENIDLVGVRHCGGYDDWRSFASRRYRATGLASVLNSARCGCAIIRDPKP